MNGEFYSGKSPNTIDSSLTFAICHLKFFIALTETLAFSETTQLAYESPPVLHRLIGPRQSTSLAQGLAWRSQGTRPGHAHES